MCACDLSPEKKLPTSGANFRRNEENNGLSMGLHKRLNGLMMGLTSEETRRIVGWKSSYGLRIPLPKKISSFTCHLMVARKHKVCNVRLLLYFSDMILNGKTLYLYPPYFC